MYPKQVPVDEAQIARLTATFKSAYRDIAREIEGATNFGVANRRAILRQIEAILKDLGVDVGAFIEKEIPIYYKAGSAEAVLELKNVHAPIPIPTGFNRVHKDAIDALVSDTAKAFGESLTGVNRSAQLLMSRVTREAITQNIAKGLIGGEADRRVRASVIGSLQTQGLDALIDRGGKTWSLDRYAEMLFRTKMVEARNRGLVNRMVQNEYDLVQVSSHGADDDCGPWEGQILSITGDTPGYPTLSDAEAAGLFHPNCKHAINTLVPSLAAQTRAYDPTTQTLGPAGASIAIDVLSPKDVQKLITAHNA